MLVSFNQKTALGNTLTDALSQVLGTTPTTPTNPTNPTTPTPPTTGTGNTALQVALAQADKALADSNAALKAGDWVAYGKAQKQLADAVALAVQLAAATPSTSASPSASSSPSTSSSPSG